MKQFVKILAVSLVSCCACSAFAQIEIKAELMQTSVLQYEPVYVKVAIQNNTAHELDVTPSGTPARLAFDVENSPGQSVRELNIRPIKEFIVFPRQTKILKIDLLPIYDIRETGPYTVRARLDWREKSYVSAPMYLDVVPGLEILSMTAEDPESGSYRTFSLRSLQRDRRGHAFLRIEDKDAGVCYGLHDLGRMLRAKKPEMGLTSDGNVEVVHQSGPSQFTHTTVSPAGRILDVVVRGKGGEEAQNELMSDRRELMGAQPMQGGHSGFKPRDLIPLR